MEKNDKVGRSLKTKALYLTMTFNFLYIFYNKLKTKTVENNENNFLSFV